jgi:hypothetical protein
MASSKTCSCGAQGCVVIPGLTCTNDICVGPMCNKINKEKRITKIFMKLSDFEHEKKIFESGILNRIDPEEKYFISLYEECNGITSEKISDLVDNAGCDFGVEPFSDKITPDPSAVPIRKIDNGNVEQDYFF